MRADADALVRRSGRLEIDDIDFSAFKDQPLAPDSLRCLRYMHDIENHTMCYLRDVLATQAHRDPGITAFLACWGYEEHWHGEALARVLDAHGGFSSTARIQSLRHKLRRRDALRPLLFSVISGLTSHLVAVHMAWGAVNELTTQTGYGRLSAQAEHPVLTEILRRIMRQEGRHIDFYSMQARYRLGESPAAQRLTRSALRRYWEPVGAGVMPDREVQFLARYLFGSDAGLASARRVDRQVDRIPGLRGLQLLEGAVRRSMDGEAGRLRRGRSSRRPTAPNHY
ncbi:MAG TPA: ferritin-like domain-containing protein [Acidimicrobiales bacterium]|nr:ferritin-like domain-containing protein [Acidimicrobiales bacterium]